MARRRVFVLLIGNKERGEVNHFQLLQEETAVLRGPKARDRRRGGLRARLRPAPPPQEAAARLRPGAARRRAHRAGEHLDHGPRAARAPGKARARHPERVGPVDRGRGAGVGCRSAARHRGHRPRAGRRDPGAAGQGLPALRRAGALRRRAATLLGRAAAARRREVAGGPRHRVAGDLGRPVDGVGRHRGLQRLVPGGEGARPDRARRGRGQRRARAGRPARVRGARQRRAPRRAPEGTLHRRRRLPHVRAEAGGGERSSRRASSPPRTRASPSPTSTDSGRWGRPCRCAPSRRPGRGPPAAPAPSGPRPARWRLERLHLYAEDVVG